MECIIDQLHYNYYERIKCSNYYRDGELIKPDKPTEIIMLGLSELGMAAITDTEFLIGDVLLYDITLDGIPYDKLMGEIKCSVKNGYMYRVDIQFLGMPNPLYERIKKMMHSTEELHG